MSLFKSSDTIKAADLHDKILFWGPQHAGKTHVTMTWPKPLFVDAETRAAHFTDRFNFLLAECSSIEDVAAALKEIRTGNLPCESIVVDSATAIYYKFVDLYTTSNSEGKPITDWVAVNRRMLKFINFVFEITGKNVLFTAHAGEKLVRQGRDFTKAGLQFVGDQKFRFAFDYVFRIEPQGDPRVTPAKFVVEKSASPNVKVGQTIVGLDYGKFIELTRGKALQKAAEPPLKGEALADAQASGAAALPGGSTPILERQIHAIDATCENLHVSQAQLTAVVREVTGKRTGDYTQITDKEAAEVIKRLGNLKVAGAA